MVMGTERTRALHNFTLPCGLRWGNRRHLRCMKVNSDAQFSTLRGGLESDSSDYQHQRQRTIREKQRYGNGSQNTMAVESFGASRRYENFDDGIAAVREKVMFDLQAVADQMKHQIFKEGLEEGEVFVSLSPPASRPPPPHPLPPPPHPPPPSSENGIQRPWNLRTRRAACKAPLTGFPAGSLGKNTGSVGGTTAGGSVSGSTPTALSPVGTPSPAENKSLRLRDGAAAESPAGEKRDRAKFSVPLTRREIEEDFMAMVCHRPPRRPKKRAKIVQKQLNTLFPGLWLSEITPEMYEVTGVPP